MLDELGYPDDGIAHIEARLGYMGEPNVPGILRLASIAGLETPIEVGAASYFLSTIDLELGQAPGMARGRKRLFIATSGITADAAVYFGLPRDRTVIMGSRISV